MLLIFKRPIRARLFQVVISQLVEDDNYTDAKLVTYVRNGKKSFWTFAAGAKEYEYVFYVPTGTIVRDVSLC